MISDGQVIAECHDQQQWRWADVADIGARFVFGEHFDRPQRRSVFQAGARLRAVSVKKATSPELVVPLVPRDFRIRQENHSWQFAGITGTPVILEHAGQSSDHVGPHQPPRQGVPADQRHLRDERAFHSAIDRTNYQYVSTAVARTPNADAVFVGFSQRFGERNRIAVVADLLPRVDFLPRLAVTRSEIPVVVGERRPAPPRRMPRRTCRGTSPSHAEKPCAMTIVGGPVPERRSGR